MSSIRPQAPVSIAESAVSDNSCPASFSAPPTDLPANSRDGLPQALAPGQLWLIDVPAPATDLPALERQAIAAADVVVYDPAFAGTPAMLLPLRGYAEPAVDTPIDVAVRCARLVCDGWSVVRLFDHRLGEGKRVEQIMPLAARLAAAGASTALTTSLVARKPDGVARIVIAKLGALQALLDAHQDDDFLTITFAAFGAGIGPRLGMVMTGGLAG